MALCLHAATHAPQEMHFLESNSTFFPRFNAPVGQTSTQPSHFLAFFAQQELVHLPSLQQHFL
jgi:hypothetical protein